VAQLIFRAYGVVLGIRSSDVALLDALPTYLPHGWTPTQNRKVARWYSLRAVTRPDALDLFVVHRDQEELLRSESLGSVLDELERDIRFELVQESPRRIFVHAGTVGWRGQAIIVLGTSGAGKTTLVTELVRAGASYYSDEYAVLDSRGRVHPFATALHIRREGRKKQERRTIEQLGGQAGRKPLPVGLVVAATFEPGTRSDLRPLSRASAMLEILRGSGTARSRPLPALEAIERAVSQAVLLQGKRGEAVEFAPHLLNLMDPWL
jgi:hypothetical protein